MGFEVEPFSVQHSFEKWQVCKYVICYRFKLISSIFHSMHTLLANIVSFRIKRRLYTHAIPKIVLPAICRRRPCLSLIRIQLSGLTMWCLRYVLRYRHMNGIYVYRVLQILFQKSEVKWAARWDQYLKMNDPRIHWFSIVNSIVIVFCLTAMLAMIIVRTLHRDLLRYNTVC